MGSLDSTLTTAERAAMRARREEAARLRAAGEVCHWYPDGPVALAEHVRRCEAGAVASATVHPKPDAP